MLKFFAILPAYKFARVLHRQGFRVTLTRPMCSWSLLTLRNHRIYRQMQSP